MEYGKAPQTDHTRGTALSDQVPPRILHEYVISDPEEPF
jgi:hypothetical protein